MKFWRKLLYYMIGVSLGVLMVYFFFGDRDIGCSYFPNDRVLSDLRKKEVVNRLNDELVDSSLVQNILLMGKVDFKKSITRDADSCNIYWIDYNDKVRGALSSRWVNCDSTVYLIELRGE